jgi:hypothetical protein
LLFQRLDEPFREVLEYDENNQGVMEFMWS